MPTIIERNFMRCLGVITVVQEITLNGYIITIEADVLRVYDPFDELTKGHAEQLIAYCYDEGFIDEESEYISCEIIKGLDDFE